MEKSRLVVWLIVRCTAALSASRVEAQALRPYDQRAAAALFTAAEPFDPKTGKHAKEYDPAKIDVAAFGKLIESRAEAARRAITTSHPTIAIR